MTLESQLTEVKGVGPVLNKVLSQRDLHTIGDLLDFFPRRYDDFSQTVTVSKLHPGMVSIRARIVQVRGRYARRGLHITEAVASDKTGSVRLVWFNQPYRAAALQHKQEYFISGRFELSHRQMAIMNPACELVSAFPVNTARIVPIYKESKNLKSQQIRKLIRAVATDAPTLVETLPEWLVKNYGLIDRQQSVLGVHFPTSQQQLSQARRRLAFEEVFELSLASLLTKQAVSSEHALIVPFNEKLAQNFVSHLPFALTDDQRKAVWQIYLDINREQPMNRLVQGDVGSGKTVVAAMAAVMAMAQNMQVAFMAPTELLARQHAKTLYRLLKPLGFEHKVGLLVGSQKPADKQRASNAIKTGEMSLIVGTHALIQESVQMRRLGLVIIDEQHRFGVDQRKKLLTKAGHSVHTLSMTATPIPRSLALTLYGELDISVIEQKPANRKPVITKLTPPSSRDEVYKTVSEQISQGRQAFIVCPLVKDSEVSGRQKSATQTYEILKGGVFQHCRLGLLHGKMKAEDKNAVMQDFVNSDIDILVATTVVEVGVDVPNATLMLVENPEQFGLAQLHQLRGRVGRGAKQGHCYLMQSDAAQPSRRLGALTSSSNGFRLADLDLELRGPGAIYGTLQHGALDLRIAQLTDLKLINDARNAAQAFITKNENLVQYKHLSNRIRELQAVTNLN